jgi:hypothetical protein
MGYLTTFQQCNKCYSEDIAKWLWLRVKGLREMGANQHWAWIRKTTLSSNTVNGISSKPIFPLGCALAGTE